MHAHVLFFCDVNYYMTVGFYDKHNCCSFLVHVFFRFRPIKPLPDSRNNWCFCFYLPIKFAVMRTVIPVELFSESITCYTEFEGLYLLEQFHFAY
jgi:hypothetical protein